MQRSCPICGAETFPGARFCRRCGAPVRHVSERDEEVSPQAATVPLPDDAVRSTDGLDGEEPRRAADTSRVSRAELERLLQGPPTGDVAGKDPSRTVAAEPPAAAHVSPRTTHPGEHAPKPEGVEPSAETGDELTGAAARPPVTRKTTRRRWPLVVVLCGAGLLFTIAAGWLAARLLLRRPAPSGVVREEPTPPADPKQLFEEKLAEAEALLAQGNMDAALAALGEANRLVPANTRAHQRLGELLVAAGRRGEAIEEFRAVTRHAPEDFAAWRQLAAAQFAEGLYAEAADSYRRLVALVGESQADPHDLLSYADALRLSGRGEEARALYERLGALPIEAVATVARQRLDELTPPAPTPADPHGERADDGAAVSGALETTSAAAPAPLPMLPPAAPAPTAPEASGARASEALPAERYRRGVELWGANRAAAIGEFRAAAGAGNADAHYYLGLSYIEGRSLQSLKRAEVVAALAHFQHAQRGQFAAPARRYAQQLEREFDRLRGQ